tara:strand:- start:1362 stop:2039 length:678 start_codon:yes stop_codon:yes gene_type:complete
MTPPTYTDIDCVICFSDKYTNKNVNLELSLYTTKCGHKFHRKCLNTWCFTNNSCPNCRTLDVMLISSSRNSNPPSQNSYPTTNNYHYSNTYIISQESSDDTSHTEGYPADFNNINNPSSDHQSTSYLRPNINLNTVNRLRNIRHSFRHHNRVSPHSNIINHIWNDNRYNNQQPEGYTTDSDEDTRDTFNNSNNFYNNNNFYNQTTFYDIAQEIYQNASLNDEVVE